MTADLLRQAPARTTGLALLLAGVASAALLVDHPSKVGALPGVSWWALGLVFALTEICVVRVPLGREWQSISLSEIPLVLGLFCCEPAQLLAARLAGSAVAFVVHRRQTVLKAVFNLSLVGAGTAVASYAFAALPAQLAPTPAGMLPPSAWGAAVLAVAVAGVVEAMALWLVAGWYGTGQRTALDLFKLVAEGGLTPVPVALLGLVGVLAIVDGAAVVPLAVTGAVALLGYQAFAILQDRRVTVEQLYQFSDSLAEAPAWADVVDSLLRRTGQLVRAGYVELALTGIGPGPPVRWWLRPEDPRQATGPGPGVGGLAGPEPLPAAFLDGPAFPPTGLTAVGANRPEWAAFLTGRGLRDAILVPIRVDGAVTGHLLVGDRLGEERGFSARDGRLLETAANHGSLALRNGRLIDRLHFEARHDELTGLPNRLSFRDELDAAASQAATGGSPCSVMVLDFDGFKAINDTLGHQAGDELLRVLAGRLAAVAEGSALVARLGGDEFAVLSTRCHTAQDAQELAARLLTVFDEPVALAGNRLRLGGSLGIALGPRHGLTGSDLLRNADIAMYAAKSGAGGFRLFAPDLVEVTAAALTLASDLRDAVAQDRIDVVVQPMVELASGRLHSVEVLARWTHPELGEVEPKDFFAAAERSGQISVLSQRILDRALAACRSWSDDGCPVRVAVNLAPRWLADTSLPEQIEAALERHGVSAHLLCLELTESSVIADPKRAIATLTRLRESGVHLSVDDFGTGFSSLTYLSRLPVDQMKIDQSFVRRLQASGRDQAIARSIVDLGRNLGLEVVAEGISDPQTRQLLQEMGCGLGQGYLLGRPVDPDQVPTLVATMGWTRPGADRAWVRAGGGSAGATGGSDDVGAGAVPPVPRRALRAVPPSVGGSPGD